MLRTARQYVGGEPGFIWQGAEAVQVAALRRADKELAEAKLPAEGGGAVADASQPPRVGDGDTDMSGEERAASGQKASISGRAAVPGTPPPTHPTPSHPAPPLPLSRIFFPSLIQEHILSYSFHLLRPPLPPQNSSYHLHTTCLGELCCILIFTWLTRLQNRPSRS
jgi:hypothetical protein